MGGSSRDRFFERSKLVKLSLENSGGVRIVEGPVERIQVEKRVRSDLRRAKELFQQFFWTRGEEKDRKQNMKIARLGTIKLISDRQKNKENREIRRGV